VSEDVIFDDDENDMVGNIQIVPGAPTGMLAWLIKSKITKNGEQSEQFLIGIAIFSVVLAIVVVTIAEKGSAHRVTSEQFYATVHEVFPPGKI
jgi:predicted aspartyl protease